MSAPRVTLVIPHYFPERVPHLARIAADLQTSTVTPAQVIVWNNDLEGISVPRGWQVIQASRNLGPQARLLAALTSEATDYVLFIDNDTTVCPQTIASLLTMAARIGAPSVLTLEGRQASATPESYRSWTKIYGHEITEPRQMTMSLGRGELVSWNLLPALIAHFPWGASTIMDDLWWSACMAKAEVPIWLVPSVKKVSHLQDLPRFGTGASATSGYYLQRDATIRDIRHRFPQIWPAAA